ncbi:MAG: discoidin domain-containing protein, partial [Chitinispirillales bacterium]|nr:discoidin domain-containing protein [Chitinispirillales bacterium]
MSCQSLKSAFCAASLAVICVFTSVFSQDLALGRPASASREEGNFTADKAFTTGTTNDSRWSSYSAAGDNDNQWIAVDLGTVCKIDSTALHWEAAYGKHYRIEVSLNGTNWTPVFEITNNTKANERIVHAFERTDARHVRMFGIERGYQYGGFSLFRFEVYGINPDIPPVINVSNSIRLNSIGFLPNYPKKAAVRGNAAEFTVVNSVSGEVVHTGAPCAPARSADTNEDLQ